MVFEEGSGYGISDGVGGVRGRCLVSATTGGSGNSLDDGGLMVFEEDPGYEISGGVGGGGCGAVRLS